MRQKNANFKQQVMANKIDDDDDEEQKKRPETKERPLQPKEYEGVAMSEREEVERIENHKYKQF